MPEKNKIKKIRCRQCNHEVVGWIFHLPEERGEFQIHTKAGAMFSMLWDLDQDMRSKIKYGEYGKETNEILQEYRSLMAELNLDEVD